MRSDEARVIADGLGSQVLGARTLAGGFSHETCLLSMADGQVVARLGGSDPAVEAAVMAAASKYVPVPGVMLVLPGADGSRPAMVLEYVAGTPLSEVLAVGGLSRPALGDLGGEVGRVIAAIAAITLDRPGFFIGADLSVGAEIPWSRQLAEFAGSCMAKVPPERLDRYTRQAWARLCAANAPALATVDDQTRLAHADVNPKNILVADSGDGWRVTAVLDWEFSYSGCPYGDAANMARFGADYPDGFLAGFLSSFAEHQPADLQLPEDWRYLGRVLDMFALSDLVTREPGHQIADQAAEVIKRWVTDGVPRLA
jgi:aminoglycoside phosphotransferase (APT) family kinase protein